MLAPAIAARTDFPQSPKPPLRQVASSARSQRRACSARPEPGSSRPSGLISIDFGGGADLISLVAAGGRRHAANHHVRADLAGLQHRQRETAPRTTTLIVAIQIPVGRGADVPGFARDFHRRQPQRERGGRSEGLFAFAIGDDVGERGAVLGRPARDQVGGFGPAGHGAQVAQGRARQQAERAARLNANDEDAVAGVIAQEVRHGGDEVARVVDLNRCFNRCNRHGPQPTRVTRTVAELGAAKSG